MFGSLLSQTDPNGLTSTVDYDSFGKITYEHRPDGTHKRTLYLTDANMPAGAVYFIRTDETGRAPQITYYDMLDRAIESRVLGFGGQWIVTRQVYDNLGRVLQSSEPYFDGATNVLWTTNQYDVIGRLTQSTAPGNRVTTTSYNGLSTSLTNPLNQTSSMTKNSLGKTISVTDNANAHLTYGYDNYGNLTTVTDPVGNVTTMTYDVRGNKVSLTDRDTGTTTYVYDTLGQVTRQTDANGQSITFSYDNLGRMIQRHSSSGTASWQYDNSPHAVGKLVNKVSETGQSENYSYDNVGRLITTTVHIPEVNFNGTITRHYDNASRLVNLVYPTGFSVSYGYNAKGYLETVTRDDNAQIIWHAQIQNARGQLEQFTLGNGLTTNRIFDATTGYLTDIQTFGVQNLNFAFDAIGNLTQRRDLARNLTENFNYDGLNRLTSSQVVSQAANYVTYDSIGNITSMSTVGSYFYSGNGAHAVTSISGATNHKYVYDHNGNLIENENSALAYDPFNKATNVKNGYANISSAYDADHNLYFQSTSIVSTSYNRTKIYFDGIFEVEVANGVQKISHYVQAGNATFAIYETRPQKNRMLYLHKDHLGSIQSITDDNGGVVDTQSYDAWGNRRDPNTWTAVTTPTSAIDRGFTGHNHLPGMSLIDMGGRIYDPTIGRFLTADPFIQAPENLQSLNRYSYVLNNPLSYTDPSGYFFKKLWKSFRGILTNPVNLAIFVFSVYTGYWVAGQLSSFGAGTITSVAAGKFAQSLTGSILSGESLSDALKGGLKSAAIAALTEWGGQQISPYLKTEKIYLGADRLSTDAISDRESVFNYLARHFIRTSSDSYQNNGSFLSYLKLDKAYYHVSESLTALTNLDTLAKGNLLSLSSLDPALLKAVIAGPNVASLLGSAGGGIAGFYLSRGSLTGLISGMALGGEWGYNNTGVLVHAGYNFTSADAQNLIQIEPWFKGMTVHFKTQYDFMGINVYDYEKSFHYKFW